MNVVYRVYFFLGLIGITILMILLTIADPSVRDYQEVERWAILGIMMSCIPIVLAIEKLLLNKDWIKSLLGTSADQRGSWSKALAVSIKSLVISFFCLVIGGLVVSLSYGEAAYRYLVVQNATVLVVAVFIVSASLIVLAEKFGAS